MIKMIAMDLDGTLLCSDQSIHPLTQAALREASEAGIILALCSGRPPHLIAGVEKRLGLPAAMVSLNGAIVMTKIADQPLFRSFIPGDAIKQAQQICHRLGLNYNLYGEHRLHGLIKAGPSEDFSTDGGSDLSPGERSYKMVGFSEDLHKMAQLKQDWSGIPGIQLSQSWLTGLEMNAAGTDKGSGLTCLCGHYGISPDEVMAFGDYDNDRAMFLTAGYPVAMGNAIDSLKQIAWTVTDTNNEGGVGTAIRRWVLEAQK